MTRKTISGNSVLMTMETLDDEEKYTSLMPDVPIYPNAETAVFMNRFYDSPLPQGYEKRVYLKEEDEGDTITLEIKLPSFETERSSNLLRRLRRFAEEELNIIKDGY